MAFTGCSSKIFVGPGYSGSASVQFNLEMGKEMAKAVEEATSGLNEISGIKSEGTLFDVAGIKKSLDGAGLKKAAVSSRDKYSLQLCFEGNFDFIKITDENVELVLDAGNIREFTASLGEEFKSMADLFMAPVLTGEEMSEEDYVETLGAVYGTKLAGELARAELEFNLKSAAGKNRVIKIPLMKLLTLKEQLKFSIR